MDEKLLFFASSPYITNYRPEIDLSTELLPSDISYYQSLIGILHGIAELGRVYITCEVSMMASMMSMPEKGHLNQLFHIFAYFKRKYNTGMVFDPHYPEINEDMFLKYDWNHTLYSNVKESVPNNAPKTKGLGFTIVAFVDSDHAGDTIT